ncbi:MAG TPA: hypothetical protein VGS20_12420 [Candidatus Acidoferrales bacterium]|nr:hypothetical protein [Candidatus Acidoferrales bacterium]
MPSRNPTQCKAALLALWLAALAGCGTRHPAASRSASAEAGTAQPAPAGGDASGAGVFTYHNNLARTGLNSNETILTPANVNPRTFGKLFADAVDGYVYAQPLYVPGVRIPGRGARNVVYVATENDSVYAFDADRAGPPLWHASLLEGGTPMASADVSCTQIVPQIGITGTPVIDPATATLYAVAMVKHGTGSGASYAQRLHALDLATGAEKFGGPVTIAGSTPGIGEGQVRNVVSFDAFSHLNRPGLALAGGVLYIAFGSHCDLGTYHGWVFAYGAGPAGLRLRAVFDTTPNGFWAAIWQAGGAPAIDPEGNVYLMTGNGTFNAAADYGDSLLKLALRGNSLRAIDSFTPYDEKSLDEQDLDLGSSGPILLPDQPGPHPRLVVGAGKNGTIYLVDRDRLGGYDPKSNNQIVQTLPSAIAENFSMPAYWNGRVYFGGVDDPIKAFQLTGGRLSDAPVSSTQNSFGYSGASPSISADGVKSAILWALQVDGYGSGGPVILHAYDAANLSRELYSSASAGPRDRADAAVKFTTPTIANGKVYFGTQDHLDAYGLLP